MAEKKTSDFHWACRNGDVDTVRKVLPKLSTTEINRMESSGSTALHAAAYYGHAAVVQLLLERDANIAIKNKYEKTAKEEASTEEVRAMFEAITQREEDDDDDLPQSESVQFYPNKDGMDKSNLAARIFRARLITYNAHKYTMSAMSNLEDLEGKYRKLCEEEGMKDYLKVGEKCFKMYRETGDFNHMITLYTAEAPFYRMVRNDVPFLVEMYKHLLRYQTRDVKQRVYRVTPLPTQDLKSFQWALTHPRSSWTPQGSIRNGL